jgi:hypothetical protein
MLIEGTKSCVDHDCDWRRINKGLAAMNHTSEKSKWKTWHWGTGFDGEEARGYLSPRYRSCHVESQNSKCYYLLNQQIKETRAKKRYLECISKKSIVSGSRQSCSESKSCWCPQVWTKIKGGSKKNQLGKLKLILLCFIYLLSIGRCTIKRDAKWLSRQNQSAQNTERFHERWKETKILKCAEISPTGQTDFAYRSDWLDLF